MDVAVAGAGLLAFLPVGAATAAAIYVTDPGPIFYRQERIGRYGKKFRIWKFRTMKVHQPSGAGAITFGSRDPRITALGYYLRMLKIDEVPQLLNVLQGTMSLVGPRPEVEKYVKLYNDEQRRILELLPGVTDASVLHGHLHDAALLDNQGENAERYYIEVLMPKKAAHNLEYLRDQSVWLDLKIIAGTAMLLLRLKKNEPIDEAAAQR